MADLPREFLDASPADKARQILAMVGRPGRSFRVGGYIDYLNDPRNLAIRTQVIAEFQKPELYARSPLPPIGRLGVLRVNFPEVRIPDDIMRRSITDEWLARNFIHHHPEHPGKVFRSTEPRPDGSVMLAPIPPAVVNRLYGELNRRLQGAKPEDYSRIVDSFITYAEAGNWLTAPDLKSLNQLITTQTKAVQAAIQGFTNEDAIRRTFPGYAHLSADQQRGFADQLKRNATEIMETDPLGLVRGARRNYSSDQLKERQAAFRSNPSADLLARLNLPSFIAQQRAAFMSQILTGMDKQPTATTNREFLISRLFALGNPPTPMQEAEYKAAEATLKSANPELLNARYDPADWILREGAFIFRDPEATKTRVENFVASQLSNIPGYQHLSEAQRAEFSSQVLKAGVAHLSGIGTTLDSAFLDQQRKAMAARIRGQSSLTNRDFMLAQMLEHPVGSELYNAAEAILKANDATILGRPYNKDDWNRAGEIYSFTGSQLPPALATSLSTFATRPVDGAFPDLQKDAAKLGEAIQGLDAVQLKALQDTLARTTLGPVHAEYLRRQLAKWSPDNSLLPTLNAIRQRLDNQIGPDTSGLFSGTQVVVAAYNGQDLRKPEVLASATATVLESIKQMEQVLGFPFSPTEGADVNDIHKKQATLTAALDLHRPEVLLSLARSTDANTPNWVRERAAQLLFSGTDARRSGGLSALASDETLRAALPQFNYLPADIQASLRDTLRDAAGKAALSTPAGIQSFLATQTAERLAQAQNLLKAGTSIHHHLARIALDDKHPDHQAAIRALGGVQGQPGLSVEVLKKPFVEGELKAEDGIFVYTDPTKKPDLVTPLLADINAYARMPLAGGFVDVQAKADAIAKRIAALTPAEQTELNRRIADSQLRNNPVHAAYLNYFSGEAFKDKKPAETAALLETLKAMKGPTLTALSTSAAAVGEFKSTAEIMGAIEKWQRGQDHTGSALHEYNAVDAALRPHLVAAAMDDLNTGQLMAIQAQIEADKKALAAGTALPAGRQEMLTRIEDLLKSHTRTAEVDAIKTFQTNLAAAIPAFNYLTPERQREIMDKALLEAGRAVADPARSITALPAILTAQRDKAIEDLKKLPITTNRDFLINQMVTQPKDSDAFKAAEAALKDGGLSADALAAQHDPQKLKLQADGTYLYETAASGPKLSAAEQLIKDIEAFGTRSVAGGTAALEPEAAALMQRAAQLSPIDRRQFFLDSRSLVISPVHAHLLRTPALTHQELGGFQAKLNQLGAEGFAALAEKARTLGANQQALATDLIAGATSWLKPDGGIANTGILANTLIPDDTHRTHVLAGALDRLSTAQLAAIQQRLQSEAKDGALPPEKQAVLDSAAALLASDVRKEKAAQIQAHINELHATPGFNYLTAEQQRIATDHAMRAVSDRLTGTQPLDAGFLEQQRQTVAALLEKGTGPTLTNREFLVRQMMTLDANTAEYKAAEAALKTLGDDKLKDTYSRDALQLRDGAYVAVQTKTPAAVNQELRAFAQSELGDGLQTLRERTTALATTLRDNPTLLRDHTNNNLLMAAVKQYPPLHAAYFERILRGLGPEWSAPAEGSRQAAILAQLKTQMGPGFQALLEDARTLGAMHGATTDQLIATLNNWRKGIPAVGRGEELAGLPTEQPLRDQMILAAIHQLNAGQMHRLLEASNDPRLTAEVTPPAKPLAALVSEALGHGDPARLEAAGRIAEYVRNIENTFSGFSALPADEQTRLKEAIITKASEHLTKAGTTLDAAFTASLASIRSEIADKAVKAINDQALTNTLQAIPGFSHLSADQKGEILKEARRAAITHLAGGAGRTADAAFFASNAATEALRARVATEAATALTQDARVMAGHFPGLAHLGSHADAFTARIRVAAEADIKAGKPINNDFWARMRTLEVTRVEEAVKAIPATITNREFLAAQIMRPTAGESAEQARARAAATRALGEGGLDAATLDKPYVAAQLRLGTGDTPSYSYVPPVSPRPLSDRGRPEISMAVSLGLRTEEQKRVALDTYYDKLITANIAALKERNITVPDGAEVALRKRLSDLGPKAYADNFFINDWLKGPDGLQQMLPTEQRSQVAGIVDSVASKPENHSGKMVGDYLKGLDVGRIFARDVMGYQQGIDRLTLSSEGQRGENFDPTKPGALPGFIWPAQALARAAAITQVGATALKDKVPEFANSDTYKKAMEAAGQLAYIEQRDLLARMQQQGGPYAGDQGAIARLQAELEASPHHAAWKDKDAAALATERTRLSGVLMTSARDTAALLRQHGVINDVQLAANQALIDQLAGRAALTPEQMLVRGAMSRDAQTRGLALVGNPAHGALLDNVLARLPANATVADAAEALAQHAATDPTLQTKMGFLQARQAAIAAAVLKSKDGKPTEEQTAELTRLTADIATLAKSAEGAKAPLKFARGADGLPVIDLPSVRAAADKAVAELPGLAAHGTDTPVGKALAELPALTGPFASLQAMNEAIAARVAAAKAAALKVLAGDTTALGFATRAMLNAPNAETLPALQAEYDKALKAAGGDPKALAALPNIFNGKLEIDPKLAADLLKKEGVTIPEGLKPLLQAAADKVVRIHTADELRAAFATDLPDPILTRLRKPSSTELLDGINQPLASGAAGDAVRKASLTAAYDAAIAAIGQPKTAADHLAIAMLEAKKTLVDKPSNPVAEKTLKDGATIFSANKAADLSNPHATLIPGPNGALDFVAAPVLHASATPARLARESDRLRASLDQYVAQSGAGGIISGLRAAYAPETDARPIDPRVALKSYATHLITVGGLTDGDRSTDPATIKGQYDAHMTLVEALRKRNQPGDADKATQIESFYQTTFKDYMKDGKLDLAAMIKAGVFLKSDAAYPMMRVMMDSMLKLKPGEAPTLDQAVTTAVASLEAVRKVADPVGTGADRDRAPARDLKAEIDRLAPEVTRKAKEAGVTVPSH